MQGVRFEDLEARFLTPSFAKVRRERRIELDRGYPVGMIQQAFGEGAAAGADLDHERSMLTVHITTHRPRDSIESLAFDEKMLAELLARQSLGAFGFLSAFFPLAPDVDVPAADEDLTGNLLPERGRGREGAEENHVADLFHFRG